MKPPVERRRVTRALSSVSTGVSDISLCCERKHGLAFESLQGNQALPQVTGTLSIPFEAATLGSLSHTYT